MKHKFQIPSTKEQILADIGAKSTLATATNWELAAELAAVVRLADGPGKPSSGLSTYDIAKLGFRGMKSQMTVERYVKEWLKAHKGTYPEPGQTVTIPEGPFPPEGKNLGTRMPKTPKAVITKAIEEHGAEAIAEALADEAEDEMLDAVEKKVNAKLPGKGRPAPTPAMAPTFAGQLRDLCDALRVGVGELGVLLDANTIEPGSDEERILQYLAADVVTVLGPYSVSASVEEAVANWADQ